MKLLTCTALFTLVLSPVWANDFEPSMRAYLETNVRDWAQSPVLIDAINGQNARTSGYAQADIDAMDTAWRAEVGTASTPTITPVMQNAAADFLREQVSKSGGRITEVFVMDAHGLNVAASNVTSDMWQGDEAKFQQTYPVGPDAVHFGDVELDASTQTYQAQISLTIVDPATGAPIGAMTVAVDAEALM
ncbi:hypothetical protein PXK00_17960 [Phaeobacter sp. QD34_3]|uniref:hypothetical protein n=2 Tax=unclassified Phaeobacter TaxID=2621772 RepID=UPI00237F485C|nr:MULTISPECIES: hypothetical protein [unclassified Phaeobacter]MDE4134999.1 hypothetical protein [Phaeobacter sp. QD34_3]MDE4138624.1 hypothetical protein [Phaeobacter sp. QD34_24]MDE4173174.1 hypothetical protein [Phaeobacter sp. PT47_59]